MVGETRLDAAPSPSAPAARRVAALPIEADERAAPADRLVHVDVRVHEIPEVPDDDVLRLDAGVFEDVELFERRLAREFPCA